MPSYPELCFLIHISSYPIPNSLISITCLREGVSSLLQVGKDLVKRSLSSSLLARGSLRNKSIAESGGQVLEVLEVALNSTGNTISLEVGLLGDNGADGLGDAWLEGAVIPYQLQHNLLT